MKIKGIGCADEILYFTLSSYFHGAAEPPIRLSSAMLTTGAQDRFADDTDFFATETNIKCYL
ncbi:MAG: hypothetical protein WC770_05525 [Phycisphaerae bacterium]|jgi:hypothetical protein